MKVDATQGLTMISHFHWLGQTVLRMLSSHGLYQILKSNSVNVVNLHACIYFLFIWLYGMSSLPFYYHFDNVNLTARLQKAITFYLRATATWQFLSHLSFDFLTCMLYQENTAFRQPMSLKSYSFTTCITSEDKRNTAQHVTLTSEPITSLVINHSLSWTMAD